MNVINAVKTVANAIPPIVNNVGQVVPEGMRDYYECPIKGCVNPVWVIKGVPHGE